MATVLGVAKRYTGVDQITPFEGGVSASGGAAAGGSTITLPTVHKTTTSGTVIAAWGGKGTAAQGSARSATWSPSTGYNVVNQGVAAPPNSGTNLISEARETTITAPGDTNLSVVLSSVGQSYSSWAARVGVLRPSGASAPASGSTVLLNLDSTAGVFSAALGNAGSNLGYVVDVFIDNPAAQLNPLQADGVTPDTTWVQRYRQACADGVLIGLVKVGADATGTFKFSVTTSSAPTGNSPAVVTAAHAPARSGLTTGTPDTLVTNPQPVFGAPGGDPVTLYEKREEQFDSGLGTYVPIGAVESGTTLAGLADMPISSGADNSRVRYSFRATNGSGDSGWYPSNSLPVLDPPVATATKPVIQTTGSPQDGKPLTVTVNVAALFNGQAIDTTAIQWLLDGAPISGATSATYTPVSSQVGHAVTVAVTATSAAGSATNTSDPVTILPHPALVPSDVVVHYSGGAGNTDPSKSLGGGLGAPVPFNVDPSGALLPIEQGDIFANVAATLSGAGGSVKVCLYLVDTNPNDAAALGGYINQQVPDDGAPATHTTYRLGAGVAVGGADEPAIASPTDPVPGVTFAAPPQTSPTGLGTAPANGGKRPLWLELIVPAGAVADDANPFLVGVTVATG